ncbi:MAG: ABC transporter permease subunit [Aureliella sp.]
MLLVAVGMSTGVLGVVVYNGLPGFWPRNIEPHVQSRDADDSIRFEFAEDGRSRSLVATVGARDIEFERQLSQQIPAEGMIAGEMHGGLRRVGIAYSLVEPVKWEDSVYWKVAEYLELFREFGATKGNVGDGVDLSGISDWIGRGRSDLAQKWMGSFELPERSGSTVVSIAGVWLPASGTQAGQSSDWTQAVAVRWFGPQAIEHRIEEAIQDEFERSRELEGLASKLKSQEDQLLTVYGRVTGQQLATIGEVLSELEFIFASVDDCLRAERLLSEVRAEIQELDQRTQPDFVSFLTLSPDWTELLAEARVEARQKIETLVGDRPGETNIRNGLDDGAQLLEVEFGRYFDLQRKRADLERRDAQAVLAYSGSLTMTVADEGLAKRKPASPDSLERDSGSESVFEQVFAATEWTFRLDRGNQGLTIQKVPSVDKSSDDLLWVGTSDVIKEVPLRELRRAYFPASLGAWQSCRIFFARWGDFLFARQVNRPGGGMFEAIGGTIILTLLMTIAVVPLGVVAAIYLHEYTFGGPFVSLIRISIHNLAGVPSIVYGVFGVAFFCYLMGAYIDGGPSNAGLAALPPLQWYVLSFATALAGVFALFTSVRFVSSPSSSNRKWARLAMLLWILGGTGGLALLLLNPFFEGFFTEQLPSPTFGKGGIVWAALTLALLTLPTVIVATEESLAAIPNSFRIASAACGATRWQTIQYVALPNAKYGILTGMILSMSRAVGQVAPLMLVGALPVAPELAIDDQPPFLHGSRGFMHVGYQVYNFGLQSSSSFELRPHVYAAILILVLCVTCLNLLASTLRKRGLAFAPYSRDF